MLSRFSPKFRRNVSRILPFGVIWLVISWMTTISEVLGGSSQNTNPETDITLTLPVFLFASLAILIMGLLVGFIETVILEKRLRHLSLTRKVVYKMLLYLLLIFVVIVITYPIAASIEADLPLSDPEVWQKMLRFMGSLTLLDTMVELAFRVLVSILYASVSEHIGHQVLVDLVTGKYHRPKVENRIFMFLDMKDSTTIAERLGHVEYFQLLQAYYDTMSDPIINSLGEVNEYIGDEVVVTWTTEKGAENNNCLQCFADIKKSLASKTAYFEKHFGIMPDFKAGMHAGEVTTGEIGSLKKEIVYTGDVLNTTARIQGLCKQYQTDLIISDALFQALEQPIAGTSESIGELALKGKVQAVKLHSVSPDL